MEYPIIIFVGVWLMIGLPFFVFGLRNYSLTRLIQNTPTAKIGSVALGLAELYGRVVPKAGLISPIAKRPCLGWEVNICEEGFSDGNAISFHSLWKELRFEFYLEDESGRILVMLDQSQNFNNLPQVLWHAPQYAEIREQNLVARDNLTLWGKPEYGGLRPQFGDFSQEALEFARLKGYDLRAGRKRRGIWVTVYERIVGADCVLGRNSPGFVSPDGNYYVMGTVTAVSEQLAGKRKTEDRVVCRDPHNLIFVLAPMSPRRTERTQLHKALAQFIGAAFCWLMGLGVFLPRLALFVALAYIVGFFGSAIVGSLILKRQPEPGVMLVAFLICFLAFFSLFAISPFIGGLERLFR